MNLLINNVVELQKTKKNMIQIVRTIKENSWWIGLLLGVLSLLSGQL